MSIITNGVATYAGRVISVRQNDERVMSDVWAYVERARVIEDDGSIVEVRVKSNFELDLSDAKATADATPAALALVRAYDTLVSVQFRIRSESELVKMLSKPVRPAAPAPTRCRVGDTVMVTGKTAGLEKGAIHTVCWAGTSKFSDTERLGLMVDGLKVYCQSSKVTRVMLIDELEAADIAATATMERKKAKRAEELATAKADLASALEDLPTATAVHQAAMMTVEPTERGNSPYKTPVAMAS